MTHSDHPVAAPRPLCAARPLRWRPKWRHRAQDWLARTPCDPRLGDLRERRRAATDRLQVIRAPGPGASVAIYAHYNPGHRVTAMVRAQLAALRAAGFEVVFVTMSPLDVPAEAAALHGLGVGVVQRQSFGRDFGAWRDIHEAGLVDLARADEVLLTNDSVLGPLRPLGPLMESMRRTGDGVFGLTDSAAQAPHLQSYFLLFRGSAATGALADFLSGLRLSHNKRCMIRRGEIALGRMLAAQGVPQWACFPYAELERIALDETGYLADVIPAAARYLEDAPALLQVLQDRGADYRLDAADRTALERAALNPTHYFWRVLLERFGFPFLKTELVLRNPDRHPGVGDWPRFVSAAAPVTAAQIREHLDSLV